jgi:uncharacterized protein YecE (DUF72 family)
VHGGVRIGTSGWVYPHWRGVLYEHGLGQGRWLERYAEAFDTVELNASFYRLPSREQFAAWRERTPSGFRFAVKGWGLITHRRRLRGAEDALARFLRHASGLERKGEVVLWQLPPSLERDLRRLEAFLDSLPRGGLPRHAVEFRHPSWYALDVFALLASRGVVLVHPDSAAREEMHREAMRHTGEFVYVRLHFGRRRGGSYSEAQLRSFARRIARWRRERDVYVYFNNDWSGHAVHDARRLKELLALA